MRRVNARQAAAIVRQLNGLDINIYPEMVPDGESDLVYNAGPAMAGQLALPGQAPAAGSGLPGAAPSAGQAYANPNSFSPYFFNTNLFMNQNYRRTALLIQNQSPADNLAVNFGNQAGTNAGLVLTPGQGFFWDVVTPNNSVYALFLTLVNPIGFAFEGSYIIPPA